MLSNPQKALLKRAQREAGLGDAEYRSALQMIAGVDSSRDPRMNDEQLDRVLSYFEAICWRGRDAGDLPMPSHWCVFSQRGHWAKKNSSKSTSRDRYTTERFDEQISELETALGEFGLGPKYCGAIRSRIKTPAHYIAALRRTLAARQKHAGVECPF